MNVSDIEDHGWPCTCPLVREGRQTAHSQPSLSLGIWDWHQPGLQAPLAYCGTSWPVPVPPVPRYYSQVTPPLPPGEARDPSARLRPLPDSVVMKDVVHRLSSPKC